MVGLCFLGQTNPDSGILIVPIGNTYPWHMLSCLRHCHCEMCTMQYCSQNICCSVYCPVVVLSCQIHPPQAPSFFTTLLLMNITDAPAMQQCRGFNHLFCDHTPYDQATSLVVVSENCCIPVLFWLEQLCTWHLWHLPMLEAMLLILQASHPELGVPAFQTDNSSCYSSLGCTFQCATHSSTAKLSLTLLLSPLNNPYGAPRIGTSCFLALSCRLQQA